METPVLQVPAPNLTPTADVVGNAFVLQYYHILEQSPELVHRFYQDNSKLGRPADNGIMSVTSTMGAINEKILDYGKLSANIVTVDAQESYNEGVLVLVTGHLTGKANVTKKFTQIFFLAPQDKGYYVLNDVFRYLDDSTPLNGDNGWVVDVQAPLTLEPDAIALQDNHVSEPVIAVHEDVVKEEVCNPMENGEVSIEEEEAQVPEVINEIPDDLKVVAALTSKVEAESNSIVEAESNLKVEAESNLKVEAESNSKVEVPKKSYASILKAMKGSTVPVYSPVPSSMRSVPKKQELQVTAAPTTAPVSETVVSSTATENGNVEAEAEGHSIYIKGLPMSTTNATIENEFKRFGQIKNNGVQVRSQKGFCFGFVEFEAASAVQSAMEASPVIIGGRQIYVEEKRSTRGGNRGRFSSGRVSGSGYRGEGGNGYRAEGGNGYRAEGGNGGYRAEGGNGGYRAEGARGRGGYGGGRTYGRGDFNSKSDYGSRSSNRGGSSSRGGDGFQRSEHGGRVNRASGSAVNEAAKSTAPQAS